MEQIEKFMTESLLFLEGLNLKGKGLYKGLYGPKFNPSKFVYNNSILRKKDLALDLKFLKFLLTKSRSVQKFKNFQDFSLFLKKKGLDRLSFRLKYNDMLLKS
jgi:hypothetical protein